MEPESGNTDQNLFPSWLKSTKENTPKSDENSQKDSNQKNKIISYIPLSKVNNRPNLNGYQPPFNNAYKYNGATKFENFQNKHLRNIPFTRAYFPNSQFLKGPFKYPNPSFNPNLDPRFYARPRWNYQDQYNFGNTRPHIRNANCNSNAFNVYSNNVLPENVYTNGNDSINGHSPYTNNMNYNPLKFANNQKYVSFHSSNHHNGTSNINHGSDNNNHINSTTEMKNYNSFDAKFHNGSHFSNFREDPDFQRYNSVSNMNGNTIQSSDQNYPNTTNQTPSYESSYSYKQNGFDTATNTAINSLENNTNNNNDYNDIKFQPKTLNTSEFQLGPNWCHSSFTASESSKTSNLHKTNFDYYSSKYYSNDTTHYHNENTINTNDSNLKYPPLNSSCINGNNITNGNHKDQNFPIHINDLQNGDEYQNDSTSMSHHNNYNVNIDISKNNQFHQPPPPTSSNNDERSFSKKRVVNERTLSQNTASSTTNSETTEYLADDLLELPEGAEELRFLNSMGWSDMSHLDTQPLSQDEVNEFLRDTAHKYGRLFLKPSLLTLASKSS